MPLSDVQIFTPRRWGFSDRFDLLLDAYHAEQVHQILFTKGASTLVVDDDGRRWHVESSACGLGCHCDLVATPVDH